MEGQGDLVSRLGTPITHIVTPVIPIINLLTSPPEPSSRYRVVGRIHDSFLGALNTGACVRLGAVKGTQFSQPTNVNLKTHNVGLKIEKDPSSQAPKIKPLRCRRLAQIRLHV